mgnify:CR=1 FL=1
MPLGTALFPFPLSAVLGQLCHQVGEEPVPVDVVHISDEVPVVVEGVPVAVLGDGAVLQPVLQKVPSASQATAVTSQMTRLQVGTSACSMSRSTVSTR